MSALAAKPLEFTGAGPKSASEQRDSDRQPFIASIELFDLERGTSVLAGRTSDLSSGGCYVDTMNSVPSSTQYRLRISHAGKILEAVGAVAYSSCSNGFGLSFVYMSPQDQKLLAAWLRDLRGELHPVPGVREDSNGEPQFQRSEREIVADLVGLLLKRGILTAGEGNRLLHELSAHCYQAP